jgi:hypothetical protein
MNFRKVCCKDMNWFRLVTNDFELCAFIRIERFLGFEFVSNAPGINTCTTEYIRDFTGIRNEGKIKF